MRSALVEMLHPAAELAPVEWRVAANPVPYEEAVTAMGARAAAIADGRAPELVWLIEHPPLYTAGTSARPAELALRRGEDGFTVLPTV